MLFLVNSVSFRFYSMQFSTFLLDIHFLFHDHLNDSSPEHHYITADCQNRFLNPVPSNQFIMLWFNQNVEFVILFERW